MGETAFSTVLEAEKCLEDEDEDDEDEDEDDGDEDGGEKTALASTLMGM